MAVRDRVGRRLLRAVAVALVTPALIALAGCADDSATPPPAGTVSSSAPGDSAASPVPSAAATDPEAPPSPPRNDLSKVPTQHVIKASGVTVNASYTPRVPVEDWTASVNKPLALSLTTVNGRAGQKIYLTRVTMTITARDDSGPLDSPRPLVDTANISPGFIVTFPYTYGQDFVIPALDEGATSVTLDFTYEFLLQVGKDSKDYYKQTAIDSLTVPISS